MFAYRTDKVFRQFLSHIFISADPAAPDRLSVFRFPNRLRLWLDIFLIIYVSGRRYVTQYLHVCHIRHKHGMRSQINTLNDFSGQKCIGSFCDNHRSVVRSFAKSIVRKLVHISSGLESEAFEKIKFRILTDYRNGKNARIRDHVVRIISLVQRHRNPVRLTGDLNDSICDTTVIFPVSVRGNDKQPVAQLVHRLLIHLLILLFGYTF